MKQKQYLEDSYNQKQITENQQNHQQKEENNLTSGHFQQQHKQNEQISEVEQNQCKHKQHSDKNWSPLYIKYNIKLVLESQIIEKYQDELQKNNIIYMTSQDQMQKINKNQMKIQNCYKFSHQHKIVQLKFQIGNFLLSLTILNLEAANQNSFFHQKNNVKASSNNFEKASKLNSGGFGDLYLGQTLQGQQFVTKCIKFSKLQNFKLDKNHKKRIDEHNKEFLFIVLKQFAITKIASVLSFGPKVLSPFGFDILFTSQCAQFFLEKCLDHKEIQYNQQLEKDLVENFRLMHSIKLMHRDIKPNNILYSKTRQKHIFCDFGISHFVNENVDQQTLTMFSGTWKYISSDMKKLQREGEINLYDNDFYGLRKSLEDFPIQKKEESKDSGNSESVEDSENWTAFLKQKMVLMRLIFNVSKNIFKSLKNLNELDVIKKHKRQVFELFTSNQYREATEEYCKQFISEGIFSLEEGHQILKKSYKNFSGFCINDKKSEKDSNQEFNLKLALKNVQSLKIKNDMSLINASKSTQSPKKFLTNVMRMKNYSLQEYFQMFFRYNKFTEITYNANIDEKLQACTLFLQIFQQKSSTKTKRLLRDSCIQISQLDKIMTQQKTFSIFSHFLKIFDYCFLQTCSYNFCLIYVSQLFFQLTFLCNFSLKLQVTTNLFQIIFQRLKNDILKFLDQCLKITLNFLVLSHKFGSSCKQKMHLKHFLTLMTQVNKETIISQVQSSNSKFSQKKIQLFKIIIQHLQKKNYPENHMNVQQLIQKFKQLNVERYPNIIRFFKIKKFEILAKSGNIQQKVSHFLNNNHLQNKNSIVNIEFCSFIQLQMNQGNIENVRRHLNQIDAKVNCDQVFKYFFLNIRLFFYNRGIQMFIKNYEQKNISLSEIQQQKKQKQNQKFWRILQTIQKSIDFNLKEVCKKFILNCIETIYTFCINKKDFQINPKSKQAQTLKRFALLPQKVLKKLQQLQYQQYANLQLDFQTHYRMLSYIIQINKQVHLQQKYLDLINKLEKNHFHLYQQSNSLRIIFLKSLYYLNKKQYELSCKIASQIRNYDLNFKKQHKFLKAYCNCLQNYIQSAFLLLFREKNKNEPVNFHQTDIIFSIVLDFYEKIQEKYLIQYCFNGALVQSFLRIFIKKQDVLRAYNFLFLLTAYCTKQNEQINFDQIVFWVQFLNKQILSSNLSEIFLMDFVKICKEHVESFETSQNKYIFVFYLIFLQRLFDLNVFMTQNYQQIFNVLILRIRESYRLGICQDIQRRTIRTYYWILLQFYNKFNYFLQSKNISYSIQKKKSIFIQLKFKKENKAKYKQKIYSNKFY